MSFLSPAAFWLTLLLPVIVVFYLLKLRRDERTISSTYLWQRMVRDMQANAPWQRLQRNLLLLLQLLFLIAIILAAARPFIWSEGTSSKAIILIFDISASMAATDVTPSRIEAAKVDAREMVERLPGDAHVTLITAGAQPRTLISLSADRNLTLRTIELIQIIPDGSDLGSALQIASAIARRQVDSETIVFSDGNASLPQRPTLPGKFRFQRYGTSDENQAIALLSLENQPGSNTLTAFAQAANYGSSPVTRRITFFADGTLVSASDLSIEAHSVQPVVVSEILSSTQILEAVLSPPLSSSDYLSIDDHVYAVSRQIEPSRVILVSQGNVFLETALSLIPDIDLELINPGNTVDPGAKLVIYDRTLPATDLLPQANLFFIAPPSSTTFFTITGKIDLPIPVLGEPVDPLVEDLDLRSVSILDSGIISLPFWAKPLIIDSGSTRPQPPLLFTGEVDNRRIAVLSFDLERSDLPLQVSFPILISRLMGWLAPGLSQQIPTLVSPGEPVRLSWTSTSEEQNDPEARVTRPDGSSAVVDLRAENPLFNDTFQPGIYQIIFPDQTSASFAVNLFSPKEFEIAPGSTLSVAGVAPEGSDPGQQLGKQEWWRTAGLIGLFLLMIEWFIYHRATVLRIWQRAAKNEKRNR